MGYLQATEMIDRTSRDMALAWHLGCNHYPPVPAIMIPICQEAIDLANESDWDVQIVLPENVLYKGRPSAPVWAIVEQHHLEPFLADYYDEEDDTWVREDD
jgi:hypothetical protein